MSKSIPKFKNEEQERTVGVTMIHPKFWIGTAQNVFCFQI